MDLRQLFETQNWPALASACEARFGVAVDPIALGQGVTAITKRQGESERRVFGCGWNDCTWFMFLKNRLSEIGCFSIGCKSAVEGGVTAVMHVFFIHIEETPAMISRLRNEKPDEATVARTKLTKDTAAFVEPINGNAAKVVQ